jgi:hypothetical protein
LVRGSARDAFKQDRDPHRATQDAKDIISSIRLASSHYNYRLESPEMVIPLGNPKLSPRPLADSYAGSAAMLPNLRLVPLVSYSSDHSSLLLPRCISRVYPGDTPAVDVAQCEDLSFIFFQVTVNVPIQQSAFFPITICEHYSNQAPRHPEPTPLMVLRGYPR